MRVRSWESVSPRQSPSSLILPSINSDGDSGFCGALFFTTSLSYHIDLQGRAMRLRPPRPDRSPSEPGIARNMSPSGGKHLCLLASGASETCRLGGAHLDPLEH